MHDFNTITNGMGTMSISAENEPKIQKAQKQKTRRKQRKSTPATKAVEQDVFYGVIKPVYSPWFGFVLRKRTSKKSINLHQFSCDIKGCYTFESKSFIMPHVRPLPVLMDGKQTVSASVSSREKTVEKMSAALTDVKISSDNAKENTPHASPSKAKAKRKTSPKKPQAATENNSTKFTPHISVEEALEGIEKGIYVRGVVRINAKNYREAYSSPPVKGTPDLCIRSVVDRNRALHDDVVALATETRKTEQKPSARVVCILKKVHPRTAIGYLTVLNLGKSKVASFKPRDPRFPRLNIVGNSLPAGFMRNEKVYEKIMFEVQMTAWNNPKHGQGIVLQQLGTDLSMQNEVKAILREHAIDESPFPPEMIPTLPPVHATSSELKTRTDLRQECVFTIDPASARDLDDAMHVKRLANGNVEVGVHIADVAHYLRDSSALDLLVREKATTTYLVDRVFHMLPPSLCMHCSLLPGDDALTFSVIYEMTPSAEIVSTVFARTVVRSCVQLAYEHAQWMIDHQASTAGLHLGLPQVRGRFTINDVREGVLLLHALGTAMRARRFANGSLRIDRIKLGFQLDPHGMPLNFYQLQTNSANHLIEEFMLQANMSVAAKIYEHYPQLSLLRNHEAPNSQMVTGLKEMFEAVGVHMVLGTSGDMQRSLLNIAANAGVATAVAINHMLSKPMTRAEYFCTGGKSVDDFAHFALAVPMYTHFTSPIRRYADVMVHRLLAASLGYTEAPQWSSQLVQNIAERCNDMKLRAKRAGEAHADALLAHYIDKHQPFHTNGVIVAVHAASFEAVLLSTGSCVRIQLANLGSNVQYQVEKTADKHHQRILVSFISPDGSPSAVQVIDIFQVVKLAIKKVPRSLSLVATILKPEG